MVGEDDGDGGQLRPQAELGRGLARGAYRDPPSRAIVIRIIIFGQHLKNKLHSLSATRSGGSKPF